MTPEARHIAMLIDGDNAQPSHIGHIINTTAKHGDIAVRRIYGNWTTPNMNGWKDSLNSHAILPIHQFAYTAGKNATDIALVIDAMDLLHGGTVNGFCVVSSDSDYTRLAMRIREQGLFIMGVGRADTPQSFRKACHVFETLPGPGAAKAKAAPATPKESAKPKSSPSPTKTPDWVPAVKKAVKASAGDGGWADMAAVGTHLSKSGFKHKNYGHSKLSKLIASGTPTFFETKKENGSTKVCLKS